MAATPTASPDLRKLGRNYNRSSSVDDIDSNDTPKITAAKKALAEFNANALDDLVKNGQLTADTILDPQKFRNPLHELVATYTSALENANIKELVSLRPKFQDCLGVLVSCGVDINEGDVSRNTPLHLLCQHVGVDGAIKALIDSGSKVNDVNGNDQTALHLASDEGSIREVEALLRGGADPNVVDCLGKSPLHYAVKYRRNLEIIKHLVACGGYADLPGHVPNKLWSSPLHAAIRSDRPENVRLLLELGSNPDREDASGQTALHVAASYDITGELTKMLLQGGASTAIKDRIHGDTALHKAIKKNMLPNVKALCASGVDLTVQDANGESPLHCAAIWCRNIEIWVALLSADEADIRLRSAKGLTVLERAMRASNKVAVSVLKQVEG